MPTQRVVYQIVTRAVNLALTGALVEMHADPAGAGHFVKMVHSAIEYGLMQVYAEGLDILE
jgi:6-phosphogluconate dehydrogenase (decarboxylating)